MERVPNIVTECLWLMLDHIVVQALEVSLKGSPLTNYQSLPKQLDYGTPCRSSGCIAPHYIDAQFVFRTINRELPPRPRGRCRARQDRRSAAY
jgi:hypothetical protein